MNKHTEYHCHCHYQSCAVLLFTCHSTHHDLQAVDCGAQQ